jgi:thioesterase domain-containing protein
VARGEPIPVHEPERQVVRFHEGGPRTPVIVLNNRSVYFQLARQLGEQRPFTDILMYHQDGPVDLDAYTFEDFGAYAARLIRWAQPRGPYILGGHCIYGVLAFEAARQLTAMGEKVPLVALFDSWGPGYRETMSRWDRVLRRQQLRLDRYKKRVRQFREGEVGFDELVRKPVLYHLGLLPQEAGPTRQALAGEWFDDYLYSKVAQYRPTPYAGDVVLFRSKEPLRGRLFDEHMGWKPLVAGKFAKVDVNSGHFDMFREQPAAEIATVLRPL